MGWLFSPQWETRADLVRHLRRPARFGDRLQLVRASVTGSHHWYLVRELATGQHWIGLDLLQSAQGDGWGYKDLDETAGPRPGPGSARAWSCRGCLTRPTWPPSPAACRAFLFLFVDVLHKLDFLN